MARPESGPSNGITRICLLGIHLQHQLSLFRFCPNQPWDRKSNIGSLLGDNLRNYHCYMGESVQFISVSLSCPTLCDPKNRSMPGLPVHQQLLEFTQTHAHRVSDAIQPSHPLSSTSPPAPNPSQHQGLFQLVNSSHEVAKVLEFQLQHQSFQWTPRTHLL